MAKLKLDLHDIFNKNKEIDFALNNVVLQAVNKKIKEVEIITGKGSGQLKNRVIRFLNDSRIKNLYARYKIDNINFGKIIVYFK